MRTTKTVSISMSPAELKVAERLARATNRSLSSVLREGLKRVASEEFWQQVQGVAQPKTEEKPTKTAKTGKKGKATKPAR